MTAPTPAKRAVAPARPTRTELQVALSAALLGQLGGVFDALDLVALGQGASVGEVVADLERLGWSDIAEAYENHCTD